MVKQISRNICTLCSTTMHPSISNAWTHNKRTVTYMTFIGIKTNSCARYIEHKESILIPPAGVTYRLCKRTCACTLEADFKCDKNCNLFLFFSMHFPFLFVESFEQNWLSNKWCDVISPSFSLILLASVCSPSLKNNPFLNGQQIKCYVQTPKIFQVMIILRHSSMK